MKKRFTWAAAWTITVIVVAVALFYFLRAPRLVLSDTASGDVFASYAMREGERFSVTFIHSVNQSPVTDVYEIRADGIYAVETVYDNFGAGVETELRAGEELQYNENGSMVVSGIEQKMEVLSYIVGTVSDHVLTLHPDDENTAEEVSLRDLCGRNAHVTFTYKR